MLGVYEECIVSRVLVRRLGLVRSLNPIRIWWNIYDYMQEEPSALTCNYTLKFFTRIDIHTMLCYYCTLQSFWFNKLDLPSYKPSVAYRKSSHKLTRYHNQSITTHISIRIVSCIVHNIHISCTLTSQVELFMYTNKLIKLLLG